ncbi:hypothetical protein EON83_13060 [bacterium]|nr:MAG: hypothetical protein EON83_13060 [bacterium]
MPLPPHLLPENSGVSFTGSARRFGMISAIGTVIVSAVYDAALVAGILSLQSPQEPISDPLFSILEILILVLMPFMVGLMVAVHAWSPAETKAFSLMALAFGSLLAGLTLAVHFVLLTMSRQAAFANFTWMPLFLSFRWPSIPYALDILAWDVFFAVSALFAAPVFGGSRLALSIRALLTASGVLALAGLSGVAFHKMQLRNIGIIGYAGLFPVAALLIAILFYQAKPRVF